jgi:hypothetical protein
LARRTRFKDAATGTSDGGQLITRVKTRFHSKFSITARSIPSDRKKMPHSA